ncbi:hypothetical protein NLU13_8936 [Sarocladium strictum]|uniref:Uncharacterized protein n=1 Tax=Sarocladium strictum TaxID=5046 RepID=A0AA39G982_SARSR|nr:hypothetical protein NLU13_8936 [Sarocladium strictum]
MAPTTYRLMTVNKVPERAKRLVGRVTEILNNSQEYKIEHVVNCETIADVEPNATEYKPDIVCCASMWTAEEAEEILTIARSIRPDVKTHIIPHGLQVEKGPDAIVEHLVEKLPALIAQ